MKKVSSHFAVAEIRYKRKSLTSDVDCTTTKLKVHTISVPTRCQVKFLVKIKC